MSNQTFSLFQEDNSFQLVDNTKAKPASTGFNKNMVGDRFRFWQARTSLMISLFELF